MERAPRSALAVLSSALVLFLAFCTAFCFAGGCAPAAAGKKTHCHEHSGRESQHSCPQLTLAPITKANVDVTQAVATAGPQLTVVPHTYTEGWARVDQRSGSPPGKPATVSVL